ncbi:FGGY-family carbohydrate kinase [Nakamurella lactea]|uniref:FGGY-family carbohydrate kinase n=1 Tax=Nakamurella lactea TaxID=459515 RepID=UPI000418C17D|nr:FGGY family carbohydrate kinase [Nakamurella lactea]
MTTVLLGIDVGTTHSKVLVTTTDGREIAVRSIRTEWTSRPGGLADTDGIELADAVIALAAQTVRAAAEQLGPVRVGGLAVTGMAEAGVILDNGGVPHSPVIAWFDPRGRDQLAALPADLAAKFPAITGLPLGPQVTLSKLLWLKQSGVDLTAGQWLHVPELIVHRLGGRAAAETSLLARTGLFDQGTGALWPTMLDLLGIEQTFFPDQVAAGAPLGTAGGPHCPAELRGATLAVAGHDHPVAAVGCGAVAPGEVFDSFGTAQVYLRTLDEPVDPQRRARLVAAGVNAVRHAVPGRWHLLGGTKAGLLMRRTLALLGVTNDAGRAALDAAAVAAFDVDITGLVEVSGAANDDGTLRITAVSDSVTPALLWLATVRHGVAEADRLLQAMTAEFGPAPAAVVAGGWTAMTSVRLAKQQALPQVRFTDRPQAGAFGAAAFASFAHRSTENPVSAPTSGNRRDATAGPAQEDLDRFTRPAGPDPIEEKTA